ncbi:hypothetical protein BX600DRAFT_66663 [Xylariales sp. PMI_506]|nr:hypothetical protein BX600DRAFT_66663 [Xylariales sp. PMI_506]
MNATAVQVHEFPLPRGARARSIIITGLLMLFSSNRRFVGPGSPLYDYVLAGRPALVTGAERLQDFLFYFLFGTHTLETPYFAVAKLHRHGVPAFSTLWFKWVLSCFVGGQFIFQHFEQVVAMTAAKAA